MGKAGGVIAVVSLIKKEEFCFPDDSPEDHKTCKVMHLLLLIFLTWLLNSSQLG